MMSERGEIKGARHFPYESDDSDQRLRMTIRRLRLGMPVDCIIACLIIYWTTPFPLVNLLMPPSLPV